MSPVAERWAGYAVRAAIVAGFAWYLYSVKYAPVRNQPFGDVDLEATARAINAGHPYQLLYTSIDGNPPVLKKMADVSIDHGIGIAMAVVADVANSVTGRAVEVTPPLGREILLWLFAITAAAIAVGPVPLPVAVAGVLSMRALFQWGPLVLGPAQHWGVAYAAVVTAVFIGTVLKRWTPTRTAALVLLAALAALTQLLRQEAGSVATAVGVALILSAAVVFVTASRMTADDTGVNLRRVARRALAGGLLLIAANSAVQPIERWGVSRAWGTPMSETPIAQHGAGLPLYLSLGYVSNPFNIGWRDPIGMMHAGLIAPGVTYDDPRFHQTLFDEYVRIVESRPWLLVRNIVAKAARIHAVATRRAEKAIDVAVWQTPPLAMFYRAVPFVLIGSLVLVVLFGGPEDAVVWCSALALAAGASAGALIVFPDYLGGVQGVTVAITLVLPAAVAGSIARAWPDRAPARTEAARGVLKGYAVMVGCGIAAAALFIGVQAWRYRSFREETLRADPVAAVKAQQFRYAHVFNDLSAARQGRLVAQLLASKDPSIARFVTESNGDLALFRPELIVRTGAQLHVFVWMGTPFHPPVPPLYQGSTHSLVFVCGECPAGATVNEHPWGDSAWTMVNDPEWQGRYRMFTLPLPAQLRTARFFYVAAEKVVALNGAIQSTGLVPELIAGARVNF